MKKEKIVLAIILTMYGSVGATFFGGVIHNWMGPTMVEAKSSNEFTFEYTGGKTISSSYILTDEETGTQYVVVISANGGVAITPRIIQDNMGYVPYDLYGKDK